MRVIRNIVMAVIALAVVAAGVGFLLPRHAQLSRSMTIAAPPSIVFAIVNGYRQFDRWSPWSDKDPQMKVTISGPISGVGAHYEWSGNKDVGSGRQEIVENQSIEHVGTRLWFSGFDTPAYAHFYIAPADGGSKVTWTFDTDLGANPFGRYMRPLIERGLAPDYELGLKRLKAFAERLPQTDIAGLDASLVENRAQPYLYVSASSSTDAAEIGKALAKAFGTVGDYMKRAGVAMADPPIAVTKRWDPAAKIYEFEAGIPVAGASLVVPADSGIRLGTTYAGLVLRVVHRGAYGGIKNTYEQITAFKAAYGLQDNGNPWEQYINDPATTPQDQLMTMLYQPVK